LRSSVKVERGIPNAQTDRPLGFDVLGAWHDHDRGRDDARRRLTMPEILASSGLVFLQVSHNDG
jgi:hypothetical protein